MRISLSDVPYRLTLKKVLDADGTEQLFAVLTRGQLALREAEFAAWYRGERGRGKWTSQKSRSKTGGGRPTKQTDRLRSWTLKFVEDGSWQPDKPIALLHRLLTRSIGPNIPSDDTLARLVDNLFLETGEPGLPRNRRRKKQTESLKSRILEFVEDGWWRADKPIARLRGLLTPSMGPNTPSDDTLARLVDNLFLETGEPGLRRNRRRSARGIKELRRPP
jgi:hypothetical protein